MWQGAKWDRMGPHPTPRRLATPLTTAPVLPTCHIWPVAKCDHTGPHHSPRRLATTLSPSPVLPTCHLLQGPK